MQTRQTITLLPVLILIVSCGQIDPNKDKGNVVSNIYSNNEIGWTINIPDNWKIIPIEQIEEYNKKGLKVLEDVLDEEIDASGLNNLLGFKKNQFNLFQSTSELFELEYEGEWEEINAELKELIYDTYLNQGLKVDSTAMKIIKIDGLDFHSYEFTIYNLKGDVILNQLIYSRLINGFDFGVSINYNNELDKQQMLDAWLNSSFSK